MFRVIATHLEKNESGTHVNVGREVENLKSNILSETLSNKVTKTSMTILDLTPAAKKIHKKAK